MFVEGRKLVGRSIFKSEGVTKNVGGACKNGGGGLTPEPTMIKKELGIPS